MAGAAGLAAQQVELVSRIHPSQFSESAMGSFDLRQGDALDLELYPAPSLSDDGRYAVFVSTAANLVPGQRDTGLGELGRDVFLQDFATGTVTLVSRTASSPVTTGNQASGEAVISGDGRFVAFISDATDLVPEPSGKLFLYDRATGTVSSASPPGSGFILSPAISADGRYVVFVANGVVVPGQQLGFFNVFLHDRLAKTFRLVSHTTSATTVGTGFSSKPSISADGRFVAFVSSSLDLVPGLPGGDHAFLYGRDSGAITLIGPATYAVVSADGGFVAVRSRTGVYLYSRTAGTAVQLAVFPFDLSPRFRTLDISFDGRFVALVADPGQLIPPQAGAGTEGLYLYDRRIPGFTLASRRHGSPTDSGSFTATPALSADGRFVTFMSRDPDLVDGQSDTSSSWDVFLFDHLSGQTTLVSHTHSSPVKTGDALSVIPAISADGSRIVFTSSATDLVAGVADFNQGQDLFTFETAAASTALVTRRAPEMPSLTSHPYTEAAAVSADGRWVVFVSTSPRILEGQADANRASDLFLYDRATRTTTLVSHAAGSATRTANGSSISPAISADGRWIAFRSTATDLEAGTVQNDESLDVFLFDRLSGDTVLVARTSGRLLSFPPPVRISPDGRWIVFSSDAPGLVPGQHDEPRPLATNDVFLLDRITGSTTLVSRSAAGPLAAGNGDSRGLSLSDDGRFVAFSSQATDLVPGQIDTNGQYDLFLFDRATGQTALVSHTLADPLTAGSFDAFEGERFAIMSSDGRFITLANSLEGIEPGVPFAAYLYDRTAGSLERISAFAATPTISGDGRFLAFVSTAELSPQGQPTIISQLYLYDRLSKAATLVTRSILGPHESNEDGGANAGTYRPVLNADGRYLAFTSDATDLAPGQSVRSTGHVFLFDRISGTLTWVSRPRTVGDSRSFPQAYLSASGRQVAFSSDEDLQEGDFNNSSDAYVFSLDPPPPPPPVSLPACSLLDTRRRAERPVLASNVRRAVQVHGRCGVPATAKQVLAKVTVLNPSDKGNLRFYPGDATATPSGILRFQRRTNRTESFTLPVGADGRIAILPFVAGKGTVHATVEVSGYSLTLPSP